MAMTSLDLITQPVGHGADMTGHHHSDFGMAPLQQRQLDPTIPDGLSACLAATTQPPAFI